MTLLHLNPLLPQLAGFIRAQTGWIIARWTDAIERDRRVPVAKTLTYQQLVDHLPRLITDLAERLGNVDQGKALEEAVHAQKHGRFRWEQGWDFTEVVRECAIVRAVVVECLDAFARDNADFEGAVRREAENAIHEFFTDAVVESAQQFSVGKEALEASERNQQAILHSALDCIIVIGEDGRVREWNPAAELTFACKREQALGQELATLIIPPELRERHRVGLAHYLATGEGPLLGHRIEVPALRADGTNLLVELAITPHTTRDGAVFTAYLRDITERVQSERRRAAQYEIATVLFGDASLEETGSQILQIIAGSGPWIFGALWICNEDGTVACHSTWRTSDRELAAFEAETRTRVFSRGAGLPGRVIATGKPTWIADVSVEENFPRRAAANESGIRGAFVFPLAAPSGLTGVVELFSDARIFPDEDLLRLVEALGGQIGLYIERKRMNEELRRQKEAAEAANQAKDRFLATLSHELRTPLNPVLMWACAASELEHLDAETRDGLKMICRNVEMEARLIDDLLDLTRIVRGKLQLALQPCNADVLLRHALEIVRSQFAAKALRVSLDLSASNHRIIADPIRIEQVFWNLLKNATKFTPENGEITIRSYDAGPELLAIEFTDSGSGIGPEVMPKLFTAFEQGVGSRQGLGLGLAICKAIVETHRGKISAVNRAADGGAVFTVELSTAAHDLEPPPSLPSRDVPPRRLRILVVEDHEHTALVMSRLLERNGHDVFTAKTVREALDILHNTELDLLVSDLGLPDGNGFQVMQELTKISKAKGIAISGYGMDDDVERSSRAGFSAHLTKPINVQELQDAIYHVTSVA